MRQVWHQRGFWMQIYLKSVQVYIIFPMILENKNPFQILGWTGHYYRGVIKLENFSLTVISRGVLLYSRNWALCNLGKQFYPPTGHPFCRFGTTKTSSPTPPRSMLFSHGQKWTSQTSTLCVFSFASILKSFILKVDMARAIILDIIFLSKIVAF